MNNPSFIVGLALAFRVPFAAPCRAALCLSGHIRSFVYPVVHQSIRRNLIDAIKEGGCQLDVFAYATLEDNTGHPKEGIPADFTPDAVGAIASLEILSPTRLLWHHEQAGIIPNSCPEDIHGNTTGVPESIHPHAESWAEWFQLHREGYSERFYWQLYKSLAAYRMALREEVDGGFVYDWIIRARFDLAWLRPLPPLRYFSSNVVWFGEKVWPMSDEFALVPRAFSNRFFTAIKAFHECDGLSWPPTASWWQPDCFGRDFEASVLFRHLHASGVPYRAYSMFDYVIARGMRGTRCDFTREVYAMACEILGHGGLLPPSLHRGDCATTFTEWAELRCRTLLPAGGLTDPTRSAAIVDPSIQAWEALVEESTLTRRDQTGESPPPEDLLDRIHSNLAFLSDAVLLSSPTIDQDFSGRVVWRVNSPFNCDIDTYPGRAPQVVKYYSGSVSLIREVAVAIKCLSHRLANGSYSDPGGFDYGSCTQMRELELVMIDVALHWNELGVCTSDGSRDLNTEEQIDAFFGSPAAHCVGYDRLENDFSAGHLLLDGE